MKLIDLIVEEGIVTELKSTNKNEVIKELVGALVAADKVSSDDADSIAKSILKREKIGSTGIGNGIAIPHTSHKSIDNVMVTFGKSSAGIDFNALDGEPVHLFFLELSTTNQQADHLGAMRAIVSVARDELYCRFLRQAKTKDDILEVMVDADEKN